ncbi:tegument protein UL16-like protein [Phocid alphaherpesvirus 1]|uniref:Tegument protein UL16-like protein n=1 Tax=Phocid alphaherpesvirus 1 TaxID=47418 RepID=A0A482F5E1_9ALPH|nr:tegument protein UL16-like protein [Phocid alphaherpesvirus 1]QBN85135.1 tegument protein UL16-like protein [Phocid alphaherpesvirus 1]UNP64266.1 tegument protein UL16-like protein [Phocid alphaherpesvirus 1]
MANSTITLWTGPTSDRRLTEEAVELLTDALSEDVCSLRLIRSDSRIKIYKGLGFLSSKLAPFIPAPDKNTIDKYYTTIMFYFTKPKALKLERGQFHVLILTGQSTVYAIVSNVILKSISEDNILYSAIFFDATSVTLPAILPDISSEAIPSEISIHVDVNAFSKPAKTPDHKYDCCVISPGVWWSFRECTIYYLCMDASLLALCPSGWKGRSLGVVLSRLLNHKEGCETCSNIEHVDALNSLVNINLQPESCLCFAPCRWRKALQNEISVDGDSSMFRVLFMDTVTRVRLFSTKRNPKITENLGEVLTGIASNDQQIPVNGAGWRLVMLDENIARGVICGCPHLRRLCTQEPPEYVKPPENYTY